MSGCPYGLGDQCWDCDGTCWDRRQREPTGAEWCAINNHPPYGQDEIEGQPVVRCYCGESVRPIGAP